MVSYRSYQRLIIFWLAHIKWRVWHLDVGLSFLSPDIFQGVFIISALGITFRCLLLADNICCSRYKPLAQDIYALVHISSADYKSCALLYITCVIQVSNSIRIDLYIRYYQSCFYLSRTISVNVSKRVNHLSRSFIWHLDVFCNYYLL